MQIFRLIFSQPDINGFFGVRGHYGKMDLAWQALERADLQRQRELTAIERYILLRPADF